MAVIKRTCALLMSVAMIICLLPGFSESAFAITDSQGPQVNSITVDKAEVQVGETINFMVHATDESGISEKSGGINGNYLYFQNAEKTKVISVDLKKIDDTTLEGTYTVQASDIDGLYTMSHYGIYDIYGNETVKSSPNCSFFIGDPSSQTKITSSAVSGSRIISENSLVYDQTVDGDLYIAPNASVTMKNVTVKGNIYVLGTLNANSIQATALYAKEVIIGAKVTGNGAVALSGTCSIPSTYVSDKIINEIPMKLNSNLVAIDGKLSISGAYVNIAKMYIQDHPVDASDDGTFSISNLDVKGLNKITVKFVTADNKMYTKVLDIKQGTIGANGKTDILPELSVQDFEVCEGQAVDFLKKATAKDEEDGNISHLITVSPQTIKDLAPGKYKVTYSVVDSNGGKSEKTITVTVVAHKWDKTTWVVDQPATISEDGVKSHHCIRCGEKTDTTVISKIASITLTSGTYSYSGKKCTPKLNIKDGDGNKISDAYFTVKTPSGRKKVGTYQYAITFKGAYSGNAKTVFRIVPAKPALSKVKVDRSKIIVKTAKSPAKYGASKTQIAYKKAGGSWKFVTTSKNSKIITHLKSGKYRVKVRSTKTVRGVKYYSKWTSEKKVSVK